MKRSAQVALVLMGVTGTTAAGAYMMPPRPECRAQPAASTTLGPPAALPQAASQGEQPCRRRRWGSWGWSSGSSYSSYSSNRSQPLFSNRTPTSVSTALSGSRTTSTGPSVPRSGSTGTSRGGFGSTGHSMSGHSGGS